MLDHNVLINNQVVETWDLTISCLTLTNMSESHMAVLIKLLFVTCVATLIRMLLLTCVAMCCVCVCVLTIILAWATFIWSYWHQLEATSRNPYNDIYVTVSEMWTQWLPVPTAVNLTNLQRLRSESLKLNSVLSWNSLVEGSGDRVIYSYLPPSVLLCFKLTPTSRSRGSISLVNSLAGWSSALCNVAHHCSTKI